MSDSFSFPRFSKVLRWELILSKRALVSTFSGTLACMVLLQLIWLVLARKSAIEVVGPMLCVALFFYLELSGTFIFSAYRSRQERINNLLLPATAAEKLVARYLVLVVALPIAGIVGFALGDCVQHAFTLLVKPDVATWGWENVDYGLSQISGKAFSDSISRGFILVSLLCNHAAYLLMGSFFRKHPLVLGLVTWTVLGQVFALSIILILKYVLPLFYGESFSIILNDSACLTAYCIVSAAFILFCYWFAYHKYRKLQVINNKWIN